ncbi:hypothetical protein AVEN_21221-1 [Araneus ventricosus]|uniref:Uncharacterized protein n=1 Tax=Araneus ventricosus TaxID=182803 RepID=A0A4Y2E1Y1_ARAVE|nr:hypothetical protein AVEN_21221-1 [Araneus ventricosus]
MSLKQRDFCHQVRASRHCLFCNNVTVSIPLFVSFQTELRPRWPRVKVPASEPKAPCWRPNSNTEPPSNGPVEHKIIRMEPNVSRWCGAEA